MYDDLPKTRAEAIAAGAPRYFTGKPCKHGHVAPFTAGNSTCVECTRAAQRRRYAVTRSDPGWMEKRRVAARARYQTVPTVRVLAKKWAANNREKTRASCRRWRAANPDKVREGQRRRRGQTNAPRRPAPLVCEACSLPNIQGQGMHEDHDHVTGKFRAWLCYRCNVFLGKIGDSPEGATAWAARYAAACARSELDEVLA